MSDDYPRSLAALDSGDGLPEDRTLYLAAADIELGLKLFDFEAMLGSVALDPLGLEIGGNEAISTFPDVAYAGVGEPRLHDAVNDSPKLKAVDKGAERPPSSTMPNLGVIALAWEALGHDRVKAIFPDLKALAIGLGEPSCFRCGWLPPVPDWNESKSRLKGDKRLIAIWNSAGGWLDRAHLHDHVHGGGAKPLDLVPLCAICHDDQPACQSRQEGVAYVNERSRFAHLVWLVQIYTDEMYHLTTRPGQAEARRKLWRAYATVGALVTAEISRPSNK